MFYIHDLIEIVSRFFPTTGCPPYTSCKYESIPHQRCQFCKKGTTCCFFNCTVEKTVCLGKISETSNFLSKL